MPEQRKGDRIWLVLCTSTGVAVDVTLNKYSSLLPWWAVLGLWLIPAALFVVWFWRVERTTSWVKHHFLERPVSYVLLFLVLIPVGYSVTHELWLKIKPKEVIQGASVAQNPSAPTSPPAASQPQTTQGQTESAPPPRGSTREQQIAIVNKLANEFHKLHPGVDPASKEAITWYNAQLEKQNYIFRIDTVTLRPKGGIHVEGIPATIEGVTTINAPIIAAGPHSVVAGNTQYSMPPASPPTPASTPPTVEVRCDNNSGNCAGTNSGTMQQFFGVPRPAPSAHFEPKALPSGIQQNDPESRFEGIDVGSPGTELTISTDGEFQSPVFLIVCDGGGVPTTAMLQTIQHPMISRGNLKFQTEPAKSANPNDSAFYIRFTTNNGGTVTLEKGDAIVLRLRNGTISTPMKVVSVTSATQ